MVLLCGTGSFWKQWRPRPPSRRDRFPTCLSEKKMKKNSTAVSPAYCMPAGVEPDAAMVTAALVGIKEELDAMAILAEANGLLETPPPAAVPELKLVPAPVTPAPPAVSEEPGENEPAPHGHVCDLCNSRVADLPTEWNAELGLCKKCAAPKLRAAEKAARIAATTCTAPGCNNWKPENPKVKLCRDCQEVADAEALKCPLCPNGKKDKPFHKVCPDCFAARKSNKGKPRRNNPRVTGEQQWQQRQTHTQCQGVGCNGTAVAMGFCRECLNGS
jgi:hypothetical protein